MKKDTIYVDVDDEITSITDKVQNSSGAIVALVLPKRCIVLQSSVNMKILKKTSDQAGKNLVLITSETAILPLAGATGLYVAKTLQSKPYLPASPGSEQEQVNTTTENDTKPDIDKTKAIGELAGVAAVAAIVDDDSPIEIGDEPGEAEAGTDKKDKPKKNKTKKDKKLKVPNFDKFRTRLFLIIGGLILAIIAFVFATVVLPRASVAITTENKSVPIELTVTADPSATAVNSENNTVPATVKTSEKTESKKFNATGQENKGTKASGKVVIYNCNKDDKLGDISRTVPAGTAISSSGYTFITQGEVSVLPSGFNGNNCKYDKPSSSVNVVAQNAGDKYNLSKRDYAVAGFSSMTATDSNGMGGGTNNIVKVVSQTDCESAKNELLNTNNEKYKAQISGELTALGLTPIEETYTITPGAVSCNPDVGQEANEATASVTFKFSMLGVNTQALEKLVKEEASKTEGSQTVSDAGLKSATTTITSRGQNGQITFKLKTDAQVGVKPNADDVAKAIAGKKKGDSLSYIKSLPGVTDVKISYSPFWVFKTPSDVKHITVKYTDNNGSQ